MSARRTCGDCRFFYERKADESPDPLGALCAGYDPNAVQCVCCWDTKDAPTFKARPACRRFEPWDDS